MISIISTFSHCELLFFVVLPIFDSPPYVGALRTFVSPAKQNYQLRLHLSEIHTITWTVVHFEFHNASTDGLAVAQVSQSDATNSRPDNRSCSSVLEGTHPFFKR